MIYTNASQTRFGGSQVIRNQKLFNIKVNESHVITTKDVIRGQKSLRSTAIDNQTIQTLNETFIN